MKYALGNMLNGAGGLNADGLSLDLQFAADKTLTARKGPTPTFTRVSTATFVGSNGLIQSAAINVPRFDHDPVTLACKGLLIEEQRVNLLQRSEEFGDSYWTKELTTATNNAATSPSGATSAASLIPTTLSGFHYARRLGITVTNATHTYSVFVKASGYNFVVLQLASDAVFTKYFEGVFNLSTGLIESTGRNSIYTGVRSITKMINGWYRCEITVNNIDANATTCVSINPSASNDPAQSFTGNGTSGILAWGAQLEAGSFPTSYIPTTTGPVTRSADTCSITGTDFTSFYNQAEGTFYTESRPVTVSGTTTVFGVSNGTANERWLNRFAQNEQLVITSSGVESALDSLNPVSATLYKVAAAAKLNDIAMSINGLSVVTDTSQPMPTVDRATIGSVSSTVASIRYYRKRLPNQKLQTLTT